MVGEAFAALSSFKTMMDIAKGLKDLSDATARNRVAIELQEKILAAQTTQADLIQRVRDLEEELAHMETWERESQRYELKDIGFGALAYMLKHAERGVGPPHFVCTNCYEHKHIATLQLMMLPGNGQRWSCPSCKMKLDSAALARWID